MLSRQEVADSHNVMDSEDQHSIQANNDGVQLFERGSFLSAVSCFERALVCLKDMLINEESTDNTDTISEIPSVCDSDEPTPLTFRPLGLLTWSDQPLTAKTMMVLSIFFFSRAARISLLNITPRSSSSRCNTPEKGVATACAVAVLYNLALALHHFGIQTCLPKYFQMARRIYMEAERLFVVTPLHSGLRESDVIPPEVKIAVYCNLGHVHHERADSTNAVKYFRLMLSEIQRLKTSGEFEDRFPSPEDKMGLFTNSVLNAMTARAA